MQLNNSWEYKTFTRIVREFSEIAVNGFHHRRSHDGIKSAQGVANQPQIFARLWQSTEGQRAHESAKGVDAGWSFQLSSSEIQTSDGQNIFVGNDTCKRN
jgi:hypothetical protein